MGRKTIKASCSSCGATGLYSGFCEPEKTAVVCLTCGGSGCEQISYIPFEGRKRKNGIREIRVSRGSFIATGVGGTGSSMTYEQFNQKYKAGEAA